MKNRYRSITDHEQISFPVIIVIARHRQNRQSKRNIRLAGYQYILPAFVVKQPHPGISELEQIKRTIVVSIEKRDTASVELGKCRSCLPGPGAACFFCRSAANLEVNSCINKLNVRRCPVDQ